uniref:cysteine protease XCP2-like n=1 Tax=Erigeron canadensis TaxID=72917 RepID=UPI001CB8E4FA|nr:cysteine protease XCP2-like [Erigeron canadensis]
MKHKMICEGGLCWVWLRSRYGNLFNLFGKEIRQYRDETERSDNSLKHISETDKKVINYWLRLHKFADTSTVEFKSKFLGVGTQGLVYREERRIYSEFCYRDFVDLAKLADWRKKEVVAPA